MVRVIFELPHFISLYRKPIGAKSLSHLTKYDQLIRTQVNHHSNFLIYKSSPYIHRKKIRTKIHYSCNVSNLELKTSVLIII